MKSLLFFPVLLTLLLFNSCNKDTVPSPDTSVADKLTNKNFKLVQFGKDANGNGVPDDNGIPGQSELKYTDTSNTTFEFYLNSNGTGHITYKSMADSGTANLTWTLDPTNTYINSDIPSLGKTVVSKILSISDMSLLGVADTTETPRSFAYFLRN